MQRSKLLFASTDTARNSSPKLQLEVLFCKKLLNCKECYTVAHCGEVWRISMTAKFQGHIEQISVRSWLDRVESALKQEDELENPFRSFFLIMSREATSLLNWYGKGWKKCTSVTSPNFLKLFHIFFPYLLNLRFVLSRIK